MYRAWGGIPASGQAVKACPSAGHLGQHALCTTRYCGAPYPRDRRDGSPASIIAPILALGVGVRIVGVWMGRVVERSRCSPHTGTNEGTARRVPRPGANGSPTPSTNGGAGQRATACRHHRKQHQSRHHTHNACYGHRVVLPRLRISSLHCSRERPPGECCFPVLFFCMSKSHATCPVGPPMGRPVRTLRRERLVGSQVGETRRPGACAWARRAPSMRRVHASVADDTVPVMAPWQA